MKAGALLTVSLLLSQDLSPGMALPHLGLPSLEPPSEVYSEVCLPGDPRSCQDRPSHCSIISKATSVCRCHRALASLAYGFDRAGSELSLLLLLALFSHFRSSVLSTKVRNNNRAHAEVHSSRFCSPDALALS